MAQNRAQQQGFQQPRQSPEELYSNDPVEATGGFMPQSGIADLNREQLVDLTQRRQADEPQRFLDKEIMLQGLDSGWQTPEAERQRQELARAYADEVNMFRQDELEGTEGGVFGLGGEPAMSEEQRQQAWDAFTNVPMDDRKTAMENMGYEVPRQPEGVTPELKRLAQQELARQRVLPDDFGPHKVAMPDREIGAVTGMGEETRPEMDGQQLTPIDPSNIHRMHQGDLHTLARESYLPLERELAKQELARREQEINRAGRQYGEPGGTAFGG